jgi:hypothetical protein
MFLQAVFAIDSRFRDSTSTLLRVSGGAFPFVRRCANVKRRSLARRRDLSA